jgi:hypothetical protein
LNDVGSLHTSTSGPNPKITNKQVDNNTNSKNREKMNFIPWFSSPLRLGYLHVVEEATKAILFLKSREQVS